MEILNRLFIWAVSGIPSGVHLTLEIIGFGFALGLGLIVVIELTKDVRKQRRLNKLAAEVLISPDKAYRQILDQEKFIKDLEAKQKADLRRPIEKLVNLQGEFIKRFPWVVQDELRRHLQDASSANR